MRSEELQKRQPFWEWNWTVEILHAIDGTEHRRRVMRHSVPGQYDGQFYMTWIAECYSLKWSPWIIFDVDAPDKNAETARRMTQEFVAKLVREFDVDLKHIRIVFSTNKGFHVYLNSRLVGAEPSKQFAYQCRDFAMRLLPTSDPSLYDDFRGHVIGIPGSRHKATNLYYTPISVRLLQTYDINTLRFYAQKARDWDFWTHDCAINAKLRAIWVEGGERKAYAVPSSNSLQHVLSRPHEYFLGVKEGNRHKSMFFLAAHYRGRGISEDEALVLLRDANTRNVPPIDDDRELSRLCRTAYKRAWK